jgi:hypothetical protein
MRNIRMLLIAALAVGALAAPGTASADEFIPASPFVGEYPYTVSGKVNELYPQMNLYLPSANTHFYCNAPTSSATLNGPSEPLTSTSVTNSKCTYSGEFKMNGCQFAFHANAGTVDLGAAGCGPITFGGSPCGALTLQPKTGLTATYENLPGTGEVSVLIQGKGISYSFASGVCEGPGSNAELSGRFTLSASKNGLHQGIYAIAPGASVGVNRNSESFSATYYPAKLSGSSAAANEFEIPSSNFWANCKNVFYAGALSGSASTVTLNPSYGGSGNCPSSMAEKSTVNANSCAIQITAAGGASISCAKGGDAIEIAYGCIIKISAQTVAGSPLSYESLGAGNTATVRAKGSLTGLSYTSSPAFACGLAGIPSSGSNAVMNIDTTLSGTYGT